MTHTIMNNYGDYHIPWSHVCEDSANFHFGIDFDSAIPPADGSEESENVWSAEPGIVTFSEEHIHTPGTRDEVHEWTIVVCVDEFAEDGWCYQHIEPIPPFTGWIEGQGILFGTNPIATMAELQNPPVEGFKHLHLMRSLAEYVTADPGLLNPLAYFDPAPVVSEGFIWNYFLEAGDRFFFLPDVEAVDPTNQMMGGWRTEWPEKVDVDSDKFTDTYGADGLIDISGEVDFFGYVLGSGVGEKGGSAPHYIMPRKISWTLFRWDAGISDWIAVQEPNGSDFTRNVVDFGDIPLGGSENWDEYKQLYFRFQPDTLFGYNGRTYCLTNCSDAIEFDGINNIEENCWNTALEAEGLDPVYHPLNMVTPDEKYRATIYVYDWEENLAAEFSFDFMLHNTKEIAQEVHLTDAVTDQDIWHAEWVATYGTDGFAPVKSTYTNATIQPGSTMDIEIIYSGPMSTTVTSSVRFTKPDEPYLTATPSTPEWTSTNMPDGYFDTWHGTVDVPVEGYSGWLTMEIKAKDISDIGLLDPSIANPDPPSGPGDDEYTDDHHGFGMAFSTEPQWIATLYSGAIGSPCLGDLDGDGDLDVVVQDKHGRINCIDDDGTQFSGWPISGGYVQAWQNTWSSVALADLDQNGSLEIVAAAPYGCRAYSIDGSYIDFCNFDYAHFSKASPAVGEVDGEGMLEVVVGRVENEFFDPQPSLFCLEDDLSEKWSRLYYGTLGDEMPYLATPAVGDISNTHVGNEILIATAEDFWEAYPPPIRETDVGYPNWLRLLDGSGNPLWTSSDYNCGFWASPVIGDIDNDDVNEIVIGSMTFWDDGMKVFVLNGNSGVQEHFWDVGGWVKHPAALADLDDNGYLDVIVSCNDGMVYAWSGVPPYDAIPGFPVVLSGVDNAGCPAVADIDSDFELEVVVGCESGELYAFNSDGSLCSGFPLQVGTSLIGCPAIGDIDGDCRLELIVADEGDSFMYCYDLGVNSFPAEMPWRQFQHDSWHTGCFNADNTIPEPPTNLTGDIEYNGSICEVDLEWELSVNDPLSGNPEEPTDVICYKIYRGFPPYDPPFLVGKVLAGVGSYTDVFNPWAYPVVLHYVIAYDGTNESEHSNKIKFPTSPSDVISLGCCVSEEFTVESLLTRILQPSEMRITEESSHAEITSVHERTAETLLTVTDHAVPSRGNPGCLTDGSTEVCYSPSPGADAVVIDLGEECTVTSVLPERMTGIFPDASSFTDEPVRTLETTPLIEISLLIEVAGSDREFNQLTAESWSSTEAVRYIRLQGASGLSEISVYGSRGVLDTVSSVGITRSAENEGWMFSIPVAERSEEAEIKIYDVSGRMIWSGHAESGSVLHWDGFTGNGTVVPNGVYLLQCSIGSQISTGSFVVRRD